MSKPNPRQNALQMLHFYRKRVNWNDTNIGTGAYMCTIPAGAIITSTDVVVNAAFNAGTTNSLSVGGNSANYNDVAAVSSTLAGSTGQKAGIRPNAATATGSLTADLDVFVLYQQTGTAASAGSADIMITYIPNTDQ